MPYATRHTPHALDWIGMEADWATARSSNENVRSQYQHYMESSAGGLMRFGHRLTRVTAGPVLRHAAAVGNHEVIRQIASRQGIIVSSNSLQDSLGATAAHYAAAAGQTRALQVLLDNKADPNAEDHIRETPLHHAAFAGNVEAAALLLRYGAWPRVESMYLETPLDVAKENPAAFLGVDTQHVVGLLEAYSTALEVMEFYQDATQQAP